MNFKQKIAYMAIGCLFTLAGYFLASFGSGGLTAMDASAQADDEQVIEEIVLCKQLLIINAEGKPVAALGETPKGGGALTIYNKAGKMVAKLDSSNEHGLISISDKKSRPVGTIGVNKDGIRTFALWNEAGNFAVTMSAGENGDGGLSVFSKEENPIAIVSPDKHGNGSMILTNKEGKAVAGLVVSDKDGRLGVFSQGEWKFY